MVPHLLDMSIESDWVLDIESLNLPWVALSQPEVWLFSLVTILDQLFEDSIGISDTISPSR